MTDEEKDLPYPDWEIKEPDRVMLGPDGEPVYSEPDPDPDKTDAVKRAARTFLQGLAFDILIALTLLLLPVFTTAEGWSAFDWQLMLFLVFKTVVVTAFSFILRFFKVSPRTL